MTNTSQPTGGHASHLALAHRERLFHRLWRRRRAPLAVAAGRPIAVAAAVAAAGAAAAELGGERLVRGGLPKLLKPVPQLRDLRRWVGKNGCSAGYIHITQ